MRRIRSPKPQPGFTAVGVVVLVTLSALVIGVLVDVLVVSVRKPAATKSQLAPADAELAIARFVSRDVLPSESATPGGAACGVGPAALVTTVKSAPAVRQPDQAVAYALGPGGLTRSTCAVGAVSATTSTLVAPDAIEFLVTCRAPGACGTVHIEAATTTGTATPAHRFILDITRRQTQK